MANDSKFTYDFGIAIAQSTVSKVAKLAGVSLTLASAFYALREQAKEYVNTLRESTLSMGGMANAMKAMEQAQNRIITGQSFFSVDDQLKGMNKLMAVGVAIGENFEWINKAAHAIGKNYSEFSGMIASAVQGNAQVLVDAGFMTQRASRMFDKYSANTVQRQQAILDFLKQHKGLMAAIKSDFKTIKDETGRLKGTWNAFLQSIVGKPNDPNSLYGQIVSAIGMIADAFKRNSEQMQRYGFFIGQVLGWAFKQVGHFVIWVGRAVKNTLEKIWTVGKDFQEQTRSALIWLEFWKLKVVDFFKDYGGAIKTILKLVIAYKALKWAFVIGRRAIASVYAYQAAISGVFRTQKRYIRMMGPIGNKFTRWLQSLAVFMPKWFRGAWVAIGRMAPMYLSMIVKSFKGAFINIFGFLGKMGKLVLGLFKNLPSIFMALVKGGRALMTTLFSSNPVGWVVLAIASLALLYNKCSAFRKWINGYAKLVVEWYKMLWNLIATGINGVILGCIKLWEVIKKILIDPFVAFGKWVWNGITLLWDEMGGLFKKIGQGIKRMWAALMDSKVGQWIKKWIVEPVEKIWGIVQKVGNWIGGGIKKGWNWVTGNVANLTGNIANAIGSGNTTIDNFNKALQEQYGFKGIKTFSGKQYDENDDTNYMSKGLNALKGNKGDTSNGPDFSSTSGNPLLTGGEFGGGISGGGNTFPIEIHKDAIPINIYKGDSIDENKLAKKIREVFYDLQRENAMRGGAI